METLTEIGKRWNTDKATWHNYTKIYEKYFNNSRKQCIKLFEIGIFLGRSLKMWHDYFENGLIFAMDNCALSDEALIKSIEMDRIRVVPNPYVMTNLLEESIYNTDFNQRRKLMFTHLPAQCIIEIYTTSGILVLEPPALLQIRDEQGGFLIEH